MRVERNQPNAVPPWLEWVEREVAGLRFGLVQIVVHDGRVVQVEKTERLRADALPAEGVPAGSGRASTGHPEA